MGFEAGPVPPQRAGVVRIAITRMRCHDDSRAYTQRRLANGNTKREAIRALKRRLSDTVYRALLTDAQNPAPTSTLAEAA